MSRDNSLNKMSWRDVLASVFNKVGRKVDDKIIEVPVEATTERTPINVDNWKLIKLDNSRLAYYKDFEEMDEEIVELSSALDVYADFVIYSPWGDKDDSFKVEFGSQNTDALSEVVSALNDRLELEERVWYTVRDLCKYGDEFSEIITTVNEIVSIRSLPSNEVFLNFGENGVVDRNLPYKQVDGETGSVRAAFLPWEIIHFKVGDEEYGIKNSVLYKARRAYRLLRMLEDTILVTRLARSNQRSVHKIDVTGMSEKEAAEYIRKLKLMNKRKLLFDSSGKLKLDINPLGETEDIYIPVRKGGIGDFSIVGGETHLGEIRDVEYFHNKLFSATKVPKAFLGFERDVNAKATLEQQNIAFIKMVRRFRYAFAKGLKKLYKVELLLKGYDVSDIDLKISFPSLSVDDETIALSAQALRADVVARMANLGIKFPVEWVIRDVMKELSPAEIDELIDMMKAGGGEMGLVGGGAEGGGDLASLLAGLAGGGAAPQEQPPATPANPTPPAPAPTAAPAQKPTESNIYSLIYSDKELMRDLEELKMIALNKRQGKYTREYY